MAGFRIEPLFHLKRYRVRVGDSAAPSSLSGVGVLGGLPSFDLGADGLSLAFLLASVLLNRYSVFPILLSCFSRVLSLATRKVGV
jgi:hypothetical protein